MWLHFSTGGDGEGRFWLGWALSRDHGVPGEAGMVFGFCLFPHAGEWCSSSGLSLVLICHPRGGGKPTGKEARKRVQRLDGSEVFCDDSG